MKRLYLLFFLLMAIFPAVDILAQESIEVKGTVVSSMGSDPLEGINVSLENITMESAVKTDAAGEFTIIVPNGEVTVIFGYPGFHEQKVFLDGRTSLNIKMIPTHRDNPAKNVKGILGLTQLDKRTTNIFNKSEGGLKAVNATSFDALTQGNVSGMYTTARNGMPGTYADMIVRGASTFSGTGSPLLVVDGQIYRGEEYPVSILGDGQLNLFADINPKDIESFTVLKDAAATAMYGSRGAQGVIIINTHQGEVGETKLEISTLGGVSSAAGNKIKTLDAEGHRLLAFDQLYNGGWDADRIATQYPNFFFNSVNSPQYQRYNNNTDWQDQVYDDAAVFQEHYLRVSGGDQKAAYALSLGYRNEDAIIKNAGLSRFTARLNVDYKLSEKLNFGSYLSLGHTQADQVGLANSVYNPVLLALGKTPAMAPYAQNAFGDNTAEYDNYGELLQTNPVALIKTQEMLSQRDLISTAAYVDFSLNNNWFFKMDVGLMLDNQKENYFIPGLGIVPLNGTSRNGGRSTGNYRAIENNWLASYIKTQGAHYFNVNAKGSVQSTTMNMNYGEDINSNTDYQTTMDGKDISVSGYKERMVNNLGLLLNANYTFRDKYFVTLNARTDASSRFGSESAIGFFPGVSAAWKLSGEGFAQGLKWMDDWRLNASFGVTGSSDHLPYFQTRAFYTPGNYINYGGVVRTNLANPDLKWETTQEFTLGTNFRGFSNRLMLNADAYYKLTSDIIVPTRALPVSGLDYVQLNDAKVSNMGIEIAAHYWVIDNENIKWRLGANFTYNKNKVEELPGGHDIIFDYNGVQSILREGEAIGSFYGYQTKGNVYGSAADVNVGNYGYEPFQAGDVAFIDNSGNDVIDDADQRVLGNGYADIYGGINTGVVYKNFELDVLCDFRLGNEVFNATRAYSESMSTLNNQSSAVLNRWMKQGDVTSMPRAVIGDPAGNSRVSDRWVEDGSFFRLRNVKLAYNFRHVFKGMKVYVAADNLFTLSDYLGAHPEVNASGNIVMPGVDYGNVPQTQKVMFGVNLSL